MKRKLKNNNKTRLYLDELPKIYLVGHWAKYGVREYYFTGKFLTTYSGWKTPMVYEYDDHNGATDCYYLRHLDVVSTGGIITWTFDKMMADKIAEALNYKEDKEREEREKSKQNR